MKKLPLTNPGFQYLEQGFKEWLDVLGYCPMGVYNMPHIVREFLHHLESLKVKSIKQLTQSHIKSYHHYINRRPNQTRGGGLSGKYILMHLQAVAKFLEYLHHKGAENVPPLGVRLTAVPRKEISVLTTDEIATLFKATAKEGENQSLAEHIREALKARDKVLLAVYYSCGLRRTEGVHLCTDDINFDTRVLHVRRGKNYKERFVPFNKTNSKMLQEYVFDYRAMMVTDKREGRLFISVTGKPMTGGSLYNRLKMLQVATDDIELQQKAMGLHTLRHSIATHLLQAGMSLEKIARFLGHATLDSTQIYTHLAEPQSATS